MRRLIKPRLVIAAGSVIVILLVILLSQWPAPQVALPSRLDVRSVKPNDGATNVPLTTPITVEFTKAIVEATTLTSAADDPRLRSSLPTPIDVVVDGVPVNGTGHWLTPTLYSFIPDGRLQSAAKYTVTMHETLVQGNLNSWSFSTASPLLVGARPFDGATGVQRDTPVIVYLDPQVDIGSARAHFRLALLPDAQPNASSAQSSRATAEQDVAGTTSPLTTTAGFVFHPAAPLMVGSTYRAQLDSGIATVHGAHLNTQDITWIFK